MFRLVWATDIHLEFATPDERQRFGTKILRTGANACMLTGDIANAKVIERHLADLQRQIGMPIYFNLGNHDFYGGSIANVRKWASEITKREDSKLLWIEEMGCVPLADDYCLIGADGWGDGILGNPGRSNVLLNDWQAIEEFIEKNAMVNYGHRGRILKKLGKESADRLRPVLADALQRFNHVLLMTHVPPWKEATWHEGKHSDDDWLPWFSCKAIGDVIVEESDKQPNKQITVFCGHTHGFGHSQINNRVDVYTGGATYRHPEVQYTFEIEDGKLTKLPASWYSIG
jgi:predicted phosphohydrolase